MFYVYIDNEKNKCYNLNHKSEDATKHCVTVTIAGIKELAQQACEALREIYLFLVVLFLIFCRKKMIDDENAVRRSQEFETGILQKISCQPQRADQENE